MTRHKQPTPSTLSLTPNWWWTSSVTTLVLVGMVTWGTTTVQADTTPSTSTESAAPTATTAATNDTQVTLTGKTVTGSVTDQATTVPEATEAKTATNTAATGAEPTSSTTADEELVAASNAKPVTLTTANHRDADEKVTVAAQKKAAVSTEMLTLTKTKTVTSPSAAAKQSTAIATSTSAAAAKQAGTKAATTTADDTEADLSDQLTDSTLRQLVRQAMGLEDDEPLTKTFIQNYKKSSFQNYLTLKAKDDTVVNSLAGLDILKDLPSNVAVKVTLYLGSTQADMAQIDFAPLRDLSLEELNLYSYYWGAVSLTQLDKITQVKLDGIQNAEFSSPKSDTPNFTGMTNEQFARLAPFVLGVLSNDFPNTHMIGFAGNNITDFSPVGGLQSMTNSGQVSGFNQYQQVKTPIAFEPGSTIEVPSPITGILGELFQYRVRYYQDDGSENGVLTVAEPSIPDDPTQLVTYKLVNPKVIDGQIKYGQFSYGDTGRFKYDTGVNGQPLDSLWLAAGTLVYQPVKAAEGQVTVTYRDDTTDKILETETLSGSVGETSDYRTQTAIQAYLAQGYELVSDDYHSAGATFSKADQAFTVWLKHGMTTLSDSKQVTQTIHYRYADGTTAAPDYQTQLTFTRNGQRDLVTGTTTWGNWFAAAGETSFPAKTSPVLAGYTADQLVVAAITGVTPTSGNYTTTVTYRASDEGSSVTPPTTPPETGKDPDQVTGPTGVGPAVTPQQILESAGGQGAGLTAFTADHDAASTKNAVGQPLRPNERRNRTPSCRKLTNGQRRGP